MAEAARLSRRDFIGSAVAAGFASSWPAGGALAQQPDQWRLGDAHAHLFSLADLPARGFFEHGVLWNTDLSTWPVRLLWPAMLDMIEYLKGKSLGAEEEVATFRPLPDPLPDISQDRFRELAYGRIARMARWRPVSPAQRQLRTSYRRLARVIDVIGRFDWAAKPPDPDEGPCLSDLDIRRIRSGGNNLFRRDCPEAPRSPGAGGSTMKVVESTLDWAREMMQSRHYHLAQHRKRISDAGTSATTIVNLLVDYDSWLGDRPARSSGHVAQVRLWARVREAYERELDLRTFAGFDPLRDAEEWVLLGERYAEESRFAWDRREIAAGGLHGFKLYPPMGFRPLGNDARMFRGEARALGVVRSRWRDMELDFAELPRRLDGALVRFYRHCAANGIPVLAHAFHSNDASQCAGAHAGPSGWLRVIEGFPELRVCLGHFSEPSELGTGMRLRAASRPIPARIWPLRGTEQLLSLNRRGRSRVYVDIADTAELLDQEHGPALAAGFFRDLASYCRSYDPECEHILFGSDWIMLGRLRSHEHYVSLIRQGMAAAEWPPRWRQNVLHDNLQRFLGPALPRRG